MKRISDFVTLLGGVIFVCGFLDILFSYILMNGSPVDALIAPLIAPNYWLAWFTPFVFFVVGAILIGIGENIYKEK